MRIVFRRVLAPCFVVLVVLTLLATPAAAADNIIRNNYAGSEAGVDVCGVIVDVSFAGTFRATIREWVIGPGEFPADHFFIGTINDHGSETYTNVTTGKSVVVTFRTNIHESSLVYVGDGNYEYTYAVNGIATRVNGTPLKDSGHIALTATIHLGDLSTVEDNYFVGEIARHIAGPHPTYNTDAFCETIRAAIS